MNKSLFSLVLILHVFFLASADTGWKLLNSYAPEWIPIPNASTDSAAKRWGSYAVSEYDKNTTAHLEFIKVVNASLMFIYLGNYTHLDSQTKVLLWVEAKNCTNPDQSDIYETQVSDHFIYQNPPIHGAVYDYETFDYLTKLG